MTEVTRLLYGSWPIAFSLDSHSLISLPIAISPPPIIAALINADLVMALQGADITVSLN